MRFEMSFILINTTHLILINCGILKVFGVLAPYKNPLMNTLKGANTLKGVHK